VGGLLVRIKAKYGVRSCTDSYRDFAPSPDEISKQLLDDIEVLANLEPYLNI